MIKNICIRIGLFMVLLSVGFSQPSDRSLSLLFGRTTSFQSLLDMMVTTEMMNYGGIEDNVEYRLIVNSLSVNFDEANQEIDFSVNATLKAGFTIVDNVLGFSISQTGTYTATGTPEIEWDSQLGAFSVNITDISLSNVSLSGWTSFFNDYLEAAANLAQMIGDVYCVNILNGLPEIDRYWSKTAAPQLYISSDDLILFLDVNPDLVVASRSTSAPTQTIDGSIDLIHSSIASSTVNNITSPSYVLARLNDTYTAGVDEISIGQEYHLSWTSDFDYKLQTDEFPLYADFFTSGLSAFYEEKETVDITADFIEATVKISDPWRVTDAPNRIQSAAFVDVSDEQHSVFLDRNPSFEEGLPVYQVQAAEKLLEDDTKWQVFTEWAGNSVDIEDAYATTTKVVFEAATADIEAEYSELTINYNGTPNIWANGENVFLQVPTTIVEDNVFKTVSCTTSGLASLTPQTATLGYNKYLVNMTGDGTINISYAAIGVGDIVNVTTSLSTIPNGTALYMPATSQVNLYDPTRFGGTPTSRITLSGASGADWHGIRIADNLYDVSIENLVIEDAIVAIWTDEPLEDVTLSNVTVDGATIGFDNLNDYGDDFSLVGSIPTLVEPLTNFRITNCSFLNISEAAIKGQAVELGNIRIDNCEFSPATAGSGTAISFELLDEPWYEAPDEHEPFDSLQILNNTIDGFESGVKLRFKESLMSLDWESGVYERVLVQGNEISSCDTGLVVSGDVLVFSNHNSIDNCDVGYRIEYPDLSLPNPSYVCDHFRYRILNETIIGDGNSIGILDNNPSPDDMYQNSTALVAACIFANHATAVFDAYAVLYHGNIFYDNTSDSENDLSSAGYHCSLVGANIFTNPLFVDYSNGDYHLLATSPAVDVGYTDFDGDGTGYQSDSDDQDDDGSRMDIGALYYPQPDPITSPLTISTDTEWYGTYQIDANVTVNSGATLTILPGSVLKFPDLATGYVYFDVYGNLVADGTTDGQITFTSYDAAPHYQDWYGVRIFSSSDDEITVIDNCIFEYGRYGVYLDGTSPDVTNNIFQDNYYGIYTKGNTPLIESNQMINNQYGIYNYLSSATYTNNYITSSNSRGAYFYGTSTPHLINNTLDQNTGYGIYMYNHADVHMGYSVSGDPGYNEVTNNSSYGIYANYYCDPFLGTTNPYNEAVAGYNSIHGNGTYNLRTYNYSTAEAEWNWWDGETTWSTYLNSSYDTSPVLGNAPAAGLLGSSLAKGATYDGYVDCPDYDFFAPDTSSECALWYWAHDLRVTDQVSVALWAWGLYIQKFPNSENAVAALIKIANYTPVEEYENLTSYLYTVLNNSEYSDAIRVKSLELLIGIHIKTGEYQDAVTCALSLLDQALCTDQERIALFSLIDLNQSSLGKVTTAIGFLERLKDEYPNDELTLMAAELMGEDVDWSMVQFEQDGEDQPGAIIPDKFALYSAFPNPFNPFTTIRYDVPKESQVQLMVYDITGRLVTTLVSKTQVGGSYDVQWNGMDANGNTLSSGLYLYRLQAGKFVANEKMLLLK